jgi:hypothetical protein
MRSILSLASVLCLVLAVPVRADEQADVQKVIDKAIKAHGGAENLDKYKAVALKFKGKFYGTGEGIDITAESKSQEPDKFRTDITVEIAGSKFELTQALSGDKGWKSGNGEVTDLNNEELIEAKEEIHAGQVGKLTPLKKKEYKLSLLGEKKVGDHAAIGIKVAHEGRRDISLYFDKESGLLVSSERRVKDFMAGGQEVTQETRYEDYKAVDGIQQPHKIAVSRDGKRYVEAEVTEVKHLDEVDASAFAKP